MLAEKSVCRKAGLLALRTAGRTVVRLDGHLVVKKVMTLAGLMGMKRAVRLADWMVEHSVGLMESRMVAYLVGSTAGRMVARWVGCWVQKTVASMEHLTVAESVDRKAVELAGHLAVEKVVRKAHS